MSIRRWATPILFTLVCAGSVTAVYFTRDRWLAKVFPPRKAESGADTPGEPPPEEHAPSPRVKLSVQAQQNLGLDVDTPTPQEFWRTLAIPGLVIDRPGESDRAVASRVSGIVAEIKAKPGDGVKPGEALFTVQLVSEVLQATQVDLAKATTELKFATVKRDRSAELVQKGIGTRDVLIEDENQVKRFAAQVQVFRRQLAVFGLNAEQIATVESGGVVTEMVIAAPSGAKDALYEVQELKIALGDSVQAGQTLAYLSNHRTLYVEGRTFQSEADALALAALKQTPIRVEFPDEKPGAWGTQGPLKIHHIANVVDPGTRTLPFYLSLDNESRSQPRENASGFLWRYRPGQRVLIRLPLEKLVTFAKDGRKEILPFVFPAGAVVREGAEAFVFVQSGDVFVRKPVRVLHEDSQSVVVANDGSVTDVEYVVRNRAATLNRALKAAAAEGGGHDHGHDHSH